MSKRSTWRNTPEGKTVKRNSVASQFSSRPLELMQSPALRILSRAAHLALMRIEIELRRHGGHDNGKLPVTMQDFIEYGIHKHAVAPALRELEALGLIRITQRGHGGNAGRQPNLFLLNFMCGAIDTRDEITNAWKKIQTMEQAEEIQREARAAKDPTKVARGRRYAKKISDPGKRGWSRPRNPGLKAEIPSPGIRGYCPAPESGVTIDTLGEEASEAMQPDRTDVIDLDSRRLKPKWSTPTIKEIPYTPSLREFYAKEMAAAGVAA